MGKRAITLVCALALGAPAYGQVDAVAGAVKLLFGLFSANATERTQMLNNIELVEQTIQQIKILKDAYKHGVPVGMVQYSDIDRDLWQLENAARFGVGISSRLANADVVFRSVFTGFGRVPASGYTSAYQTWTKTVMDRLSGQIRHGKWVNNSLLDSVVVLNDLRKKARNADSRLAAIQASAVIAGEIAGRLTVLSDQFQESADLQTSWIGMQAQEKATAVASQDHYFTYIPDGSDSGNAVISAK